MHELTLLRDSPGRRFGYARFNDPQLPRLLHPLRGLRAADVRVGHWATSTSRRGRH